VYKLHRSMGLSPGRCAPDTSQTDRQPYYNSRIPASVRAECLLIN